MVVTSITIKLLLMVVTLMVIKLLSTAVISRMLIKLM